MRHVIALTLTIICVAAAPDRAAAQDILQHARSAPTRAEGLALLEGHLSRSPEDVDARTLYGLMLSWEKRYDDARREHSDYILRREPGHKHARQIRQRLDAAERPWMVGATVVADTFSDDRSAWHEELVAVTRQTPVGPVIARGGRATRFGLSDEQIEVEFYPAIRPGTYGFVGVGVSPDHVLYPRTRVAFEIYQAVGNGFEASAGYRRLGFGEAVDVYAASLSKYAGNWLMTGGLNYINAAARETSMQLQVRRYFGADGSSYAAVSFGRGVNRGEIRGEGDLLLAGTNSVRAAVAAFVTERVRLNLDAGASRTLRDGGALWQRTAAAGASIRF